jgi:uncharacterized protein YrzB (UPF0473 family)
MAKAPELKIEQTYALFQKEGFQKPELNTLLFKLDGDKRIFFSSTPLLEFDIGTDGKAKNIVLLSDEEISKVSISEGKFKYYSYTLESIPDLDLLKAVSYAQRQKQEVFLSQKDGSFPPIGFTVSIYIKAPSIPVFVFDWLSDVCDDRPDLFIGGLFQKPNKFQLGVFSLLNVLLVSSEGDLDNFKVLLDIENAKYVMNIEKKKGFGKDFLVNVPKSIEIQDKEGKNMGITQVGTEEITDPSKKDKETIPLESSSSKD